MKFLITIATLLFASCCFAQQQNVYFFKLNGDPTDNKDSSDFVRLVRPPEKDSKLYQVLEYYPNGNQKLAAQSLTIEPATFEGASLSFFKTGQRRSISTYSKGRLVKDFYEYYPNGKLYQYKKYPDEILKNDIKPAGDKGDYLLQEAYDSLGTVKVKDGNGYYTVYNDDFTQVTEEGPIKNGKKDGLWKGVDKERNTAFEEKYEDGVLISGTAVHEGQSNNYSKARFTKPKFPNGEHALGAFMGTRIRYPAADREKGIQGIVYIKFIVEKDGSLTDVHVIKSVSTNIDAEALKVLKSTPIWIPGTNFGLPVRAEYRMPIIFALAER
jgi:TonB family protein